MTTFKKLFILFTTLLIMAGCAFGNAMDRGDEYYKKGNYERALQSYEQALKIDPDSEEARQAIELTKRKLVEDYRVKSEQQLAADDYHGAIMTAHLAHRALPQARTTAELIEKVSGACFERADALMEAEAYAHATSIYGSLYDRLPPVSEKAEKRLIEVKSRWATQLVEGAAVAERDGRPADAMLQYGKAAQLTDDATLGGHRDRLRRQLIDRWTYLLVLEGSRTGFSSSVASSLRGIGLGTLLIVDGQDAAGREVRASGNISMSSPQYRRETSTRIATKQYQSGTRQVPNPFYQNRVNDLEREERELIDIENDISRLQNDIARYQQQVSAEGPSPGTSTGAEQNLDRAVRNLEYERDRLRRQRDDVQRALEALRDEPQTKEEPVYSTLEYEIRTTTIIGEASISGAIRHADGRPRIDMGTAVSVSASDDEHGSYPQAGITGDPLNLPGERVLDQALFDKAVSWVGEQAGASFGSWREKIFKQAQAARTDDERVELYMTYILTWPNDVKPEAATAIASLRGIPDPATVARGE